MPAWCRTGLCAERIFGIIRVEYTRTAAAVQAIKGESELLESERHADSRSAGATLTSTR